MKKTILYFLFFFLLFFSGQHVQAETSNKIQDRANEEIGQYDFSEITNYWNDILYKYGSYLPESKQGSLTDFIKSSGKEGYSGYFKGFMHFFLDEFRVQGKLLSMLIILTILSTFLQMLQNSFEKSTISKLAQFIVFSVLLILALNSFKLAMNLTLDTISTMKHYVAALLPIIIAFMASSGSVVSAAFFHPIIIFLTNTSSILMEKFILPLLFIATLLSIVSLMSETYKVTKLASFIRNFSIGAIGIYMTIFLGVISVQGTTTAISDGIAIRTAKFVTGNFVPVVGRLFTDAAETVLGASQLMKNTVGIAGVVVLLIIISFPAIKILVLAIVYRLTAAILQPLNGGVIVKCIDEIGKNITYLFASLAIVSFMFFLTITVLVAASNVPMMIR